MEKSSVKANFPLFIIKCFALYKTFIYLHAPLLLQWNPANGHPSTGGTHIITDNSGCPNCHSVDFNTFELPA